MKRPTHPEVKEAYLNYAAEYLENNPGILMKKGKIPSFRFLISKQSNFKDFVKTKDDSTHKSMYKAFNRLTATDGPSRPTLQAITEGFELPINYGYFFDEIQAENYDFIKYLNKSFNPYKWEIPIKTFSVIPKEVKPNLNADKFYNGYPPDWSDLSADFDFQRTCYSEKNGIRETVFKLITNLNQLHFYFLVGVAGTGKTTTLKRLAFDLSKSISNVYYYEKLEKEETEAHDVYNEMVNIITRNSHKKIIFIFNECYDLIRPVNYLQLQKLREDFYTRKILFIMGENLTNYNNLTLESSIIPQDLRTLKKLALLEPSEIDAILLKIDQLEKEGKLTKIPRFLQDKELKKLCVTKFGSHLLVVFLQLRKGKRFTDIINDECRNLEKIDPTNFSIKVYSLVCLFRSLNLEIPASLLFNSFSQDSWNGFNIIARNCSDILIVKNGRLLPRHQIIANEVVNFYFKNKGQLLLECLLSIFDADTLSEDKRLANFLLELFNVDRLHLQLLNIFNRDENLIRNFYLNFVEYTKENPNYFISYFISYGWFEKSVLNPRKAANLFHTVIKREEDNAFALRMLAYCFLDLKQWEKSAEYAIKAFHAAKGEKAKLQAAIILSYNQYDNFLKAGNLFSLLNKSKNKTIKKESEKYLKCLEDLSRLPIIDQDEFNIYILKKLRPKIIHLNRLVSKGNRVNSAAMYKILIRQQDNITLNYDELNSLRNVFDKHYSNKIKSFYYRLLAVSLMNKMKSMEQFVRLQEIEDLFNQSIAYNPNDCFSYYYYAIYMRDFKEEYSAAEDLFRLAIKIGDDSRTPNFNSHPKFLNELAVLLVEVSQINNDDKKLLESFRLFKKALDEVEKRRIVYASPKNNLIKYFTQSGNKFIPVLNKYIK